MTISVLHSPVYSGADPERFIRFAQTCQIFRDGSTLNNSHNVFILNLNPISTGGRCSPRKFCLPVDNVFSFESIATKFGDFS